MNLFKRVLPLKHQVDEGDKPRLLQDKKFRKPWYLRELGLRKRCAADKKLIICVVLSGLGVSALGSGLTAIGFVLLQNYNALQLIGPVLSGCGVLILFLSIEICVRRHRIMRKIAGENDVEIKRHVDPDLIIFTKPPEKSVGCFPITMTVSERKDSCEEPDEVMVIETTTKSEGDSKTEETNTRNVPKLDEKNRLVEEISFGPSLCGLKRPKVRIIPPTPNDPADEAIPDPEYIELLLCPKRLKSKK